MRTSFAAAVAVFLLAGQAQALTPAVVTETARGVRPALEEICSRPQAETEEVPFLRRMVSRYGFEPDGDQFRYMGDDGELIVASTAEGCTFRIYGDAAMVVEADRQLQAFATRAALTARASDQTVSGEDGRRISRARSAAGRASRSWQVFDDFNGRDKPSRIDGVYLRRTP